MGLNRSRDETTTSDQNNLSDYSIPSQRTKKPGRVDISNDCVWESV